MQLSNADAEGNESVASSLQARNSTQHLDVNILRGLHVYIFVAKPFAIEVDPSSYSNQSIENKPLEFIGNIMASYGFGRCDGYPHQADRVSL